MSLRAIRAEERAIAQEIAAFRKAGAIFLDELTHDERVRLHNTDRIYRHINLGQFIWPPTRS